MGLWWCGGDRMMGKVKSAVVVVVDVKGGRAGGSTVEQGKLQ